MSRHEQQPPNGHHHGEPFQPSPLLPELADFLKHKDYTALLQASDQGTVLVVKAPGHEIQSVRGRVPILLRHELYDHQAAPVIRMTLRIHDRPGSSLALETFINVEDEQQRADYAALQHQQHLYMLFYDEGLQHRLTKGVRLSDQDTIARIVGQADQLYAAIPPERFDFDRAKAAVVEATQL